MEETGGEVERVGYLASARAGKRGQTAGQDNPYTSIVEWSFESILMRLRQWACQLAAHYKNRPMSPLLCFFQKGQAVTIFVNLVTGWNLSQRVILNVFGEEVEGLTLAVT